MEELLSRFTNRSDLLELARLSELADCYEEMATIMKTLTETGGQPLNEEERNLLSIAYRNVVGARRSSWRAISAIEAKNAKGIQPDIIQNYKQRIADELRKYCFEVADLVDKYLLPAGGTIEEKVFYLKMKGDYYRYFVEASTDLNCEKSEVTEHSHSAYKQAFEMACDLAPTNSVRLALNLNYSVFYYEILNDTKQAIDLAKEAFNDAAKEFDPSVQMDPNGDKKRFQEIELMMQLLGDNLALWSSELEQLEQEVF